MESRISNQNWSLIERVSVSNSFSVEVTCERLWIVHSLGGLQDLLINRSNLVDADALVVGDRTNILFTKNCKSLIVPAIRGIRSLSCSPRLGLVRVGAGESWDAFVQWSLGHGLSGLENLAGIPGTVGASPVQNIGAYGVEVSSLIHGVRCIDRCSQKLVYLRNHDCEFGYRTSTFKVHPQRYLIASVDFCLNRNGHPDISYKALQQELCALGVAQPCPENVATAVRRLRERRLPSPLLHGNAGSFFKNPIVSVELAQTLKRRHPKLPIFPFDKSHRKLAAAWLIESCGFRGHKQGLVGVSEQHALVLVNLGSATGSEIWRFAQEIQRQVSMNYGVELQPEPLIV